MGKGLFSSPHYTKYAEIVTFESIPKVKGAIHDLKGEFNHATQPSKQLRVMRVTQYAANRAGAASKRENLSRDKKFTLQSAQILYDKAAKEMQKDYKEYKESHQAAGTGRL